MPAIAPHPGIDGVSRVYRFHRIAPHELFLLVGLADEEILAEWKGNAAIILGLVCCFRSARWFCPPDLCRLAKTRSGPAGWMSLNTALALRNQEAEAARQKSRTDPGFGRRGWSGSMPRNDHLHQRRGARHAGLGRGRGVGADLHALTHHHHADGRPFPADECPIAATLRDGQTRHVADDCYWRRDGSPFISNTPSRPCCRMASQAVRSMSSATSACANENEAELAAYRHDLESLVAERTAALNDVEARASHLLESSAAGLFGIDRGGLITFINPAACDLLAIRQSASSASRRTSFSP